MDFQKNEFIAKVKQIAAFGEQEKGLTNAIRETEAEIEAVKGKISQINEDLIRAIIMPRAKKEKKREEIRKLEAQIAEKKEKTAALQLQLQELIRERFGSDTIPQVFFGRYPQGKNGEIQPIEWDVLYRKGNYVLLTSRFILDQMKYAEELADTPWSDSLIRKWLNSDFLMNSFTPEEREIIYEKEIANPANEPYHTPGSDNTVDFVFLPSISEVKRFTDYDQDRMAFATEYAKERGVAVIEETGGSYWWLRSNGGNMYNAAVVNFRGYVFEYGFYIVSDRYGVRPSIWIALPDEQK